MNMMQCWPRVREIYENAGIVVVGSVNGDGSPHVTPIGSLVLRDDCTGYYIETFTEMLPANLDRDNRINVCAVNVRSLDWACALLSGWFPKPLGIRLVGRAGRARPLAEDEREAFSRKTRLLRAMPGHRALCDAMKTARDVVFERFLPIRAGAMTRGHWPAQP